MTLQQRRSFETYLRTGRRPDSASDAPGAPEVKFNPNHDPDNGQFTFAGGGAGNAAADIIVTARRPHPAPDKPVVAPVKGPFKRRPHEVGIDGEVADKLNKLIEDPHASVELTLAGTPVTISRTGPDTARVTGQTPLGEFHMDGKFHVVPDQEAVMVSGLDPSAPSSSVPRGVNMASFPSNIAIKRDSQKRMMYQINKPVIAKDTIFGRTWVHQDAGSYLFKH